MTEHLTPRDKRTLGLWLAAAVAAFVIWLALYERAFPEASVTIRVDRNEAIDLSRDFLQALGHDVALYGFYDAAAFRADSDLKHYVEKELGKAELETLLDRGHTVWWWSCRWFYPEEQEEFLVEVAPDGRILGFNHTVPELHYGAILPEGDALGIAEEFAASLDGISLSDYDLVRSTATARPNRRDHYFTWEQRDKDVKDATLRLGVTVGGDMVKAFSHYTHLPEGWKISESERNAMRRFLMRAASLGRGVLYVLVGLMFVVYLTRRRLRVRFALVLGAGLVSLIIANAFNESSLAWMRYSTTETASDFFWSEFDRVLNSSISSFVVVVLCASTGDALQRRFGRIPLAIELRPWAWRHKPLFMAAAVGACLAMVHAAYVSAFYMAGHQVGVWSPVSHPYTSSLTTPYPWLAPFTIGFSASLHEELLFRLCGIFLVLRFTGRVWLAVAAPALVWAFLHSNYPQDPAYIRGVELTVVGILYGFVLLQFGLLSTLIAHYAYNALVSSMILFRSDDLYFVLSGVAVVGLMFAPMLPGGLLLLRRRGFPVLVLEKESLRAPKQLIRSAAHYDVDRYRRFVPLPAWQYGVLCVLAASGLWYQTTSSDSEGFGSYIEVHMNRTEATETARRHLESKGVDLSGYRPHTSFVNDLSGDEIQFLYEHTNLTELNDLCARHLPHAARWKVLFYKPREYRWYDVTVYLDGSAPDYWVRLMEDDPGVSISQDEALAVAKRYLTTTRGLDLDEYELIASSTQDRPNRTDHGFVWEHASESVGGGAFQVYIPVVGDAATYHSRYLRVPESWERDREEPQFAEFARLISFLVFGAIFIRMIVKHRFRWRVGFVAGLIALPIAIIGKLNDWPKLWGRYSPTSDPNVYLAEAIVRYIAESVGVFIGVVVLATFAEAFLRLAFPTWNTLRHWLGRPFVNLDRLGAGFQVERLPLRKVWGEALVIGGLASLILSNPSPSEFADDSRRSPIGTAPTAQFVGGYETAVPLVEIAVDAILAGATFLTGLCLILGVYRCYVRRFYFALPIIALLAFIYSVNMHPEDDEAAVELFFYSIGGISLVIALIWALGRWVFRNNVPAYCAVIPMAFIYQEGCDLVTAADTSLWLHGWALIAVWLSLFGFGAWLLYTSSVERAPDFLLQLPAPGGLSREPIPLIHVSSIANKG